MPQALNPLSLIYIGKGEILPTPEMDETEGFQCLWPSNWIIYIPFVLENFQLLLFLTGRPILITPEGQFWEKGTLPTPKVDDTEGFGCLLYPN